MGTFCTTTSLETLMIDTDFSSFSNSSVLLSAAISDAEAEIRRALANRYDMSADYFQTSTATPPAISKICKWMAMGYFYMHNSRGGKDAFLRADKYISMAKAELKEIRERKADLVDSDGELIPDTTKRNKALSTTNDYRETFAEDSELNWAVDPDKIDDLETERD